MREAAVVPASAPARRRGHGGRALTGRGDRALGCAETPRGCTPTPPARARCPGRLILRFAGPAASFPSLQECRFHLSPGDSSPRPGPRARCRGAVRVRAKEQLRDQNSTTQDADQRLGAGPGLESSGQEGSRREGGVKGRVLIEGPAIVKAGPSLEGGSRGRALVEGRGLTIRPMGGT